MSDPLSATIVGGAISLVTTVVTTFGLEQIRRTRETRGAAYALKGSVTAILSILEIRQYVGHISETIKQLESGQNVEVLTVRVKQNYLEAYSKYLDKIGGLADPLPEQISMFFTNVNSLIEDLQAAQEGQLKTARLEEKLRLCREFLTLLKTTINIGEEIVTSIKASYPPEKKWALTISFNR